MPASEAGDAPSARSSPLPLPGSVDQTLDLLASGGYVTDRGLATSLFLSLTLERPLFLEGEAGVGKTELAKTLAEALGRRLIRLQCYEGLDLASAVYEWNYARQMLEIRVVEATEGMDRDRLSADIFSEHFLIRRPLLEALEPHIEGPPVLLIDELDRTDEPFEAFLLEVLSDFQVTVPEVGTIRADRPPLVIITSNRTREVHDALARELEILRVKVPGAPERLSRQVVAFVQRIRDADLFKVPGVAESIDWARALLALDQVELNPDVVNDTLGVLLKYQDDVERLRGDEAAQTLRDVERELAAAPRA
jgi:MoxR-like ATPase